MDAEQLPTRREKNLVHKWRHEANACMMQIRKVNYVDQSHRIMLYHVAKTLRQCAKALARELKHTEARNGR